MLQYFKSKKESNFILNRLGPDLVSVIKAAPGNIFLCGGALTSIFSNEKINDFDLYFETEEAFKYLNTHIESTCKHSAVYSSDNAMTYRVLSGNTMDNNTLQLIRKPCVFSRPIKEILNLFDFTISQVGYTFNTAMFTSSDRFIYDLSKKKLVFNPDSPTPLNSIIRIKKFLKRGFDISSTEFLKVAFCVNKLDLDCKSVILNNITGLGSFELEALTEIFRKDEEDGKVTDVKGTVDRFLNGEFDELLEESSKPVVERGTVTFSDEDIPF